LNSGKLARKASVLGALVVKVFSLVADTKARWPVLRGLPRTEIVRHFVPPGVVLHLDRAESTR
jgi:hypothetical protein